MAVTNVAEIKEVLAGAGYKAESTANGGLRVNTNSLLYGSDLGLFMTIRNKYNVMLTIKRSGAGIRILFM